MSPWLIIVGIAFVVWRYRKLLGLDKTWERHGRSYAQDLAAQLGWSKARPRTEQPAAAHRQMRDRPARSSRGGQIDSRQLPAALVAGVVVGTIAFSLEVTGHSLLAGLVALAIGPVAGGLYIRSRWWVLVAVFVAVIVGAGGRASSIWVGLAVAALTYGVIQIDARAWLARWTSES